MKDFREAFTEILGEFVVPLLKDQGSVKSVLIQGISGFKTRIENLLVENKKDAERIEMLEECRPSVELKV
jgi:hypothetical protein